MKKNIKLFVFDFDGTALGGHIPYNQFPSEFAAFLDKISASGISWGTNTTWAPQEQYELMKKSGLKSMPAILTGQTGRIVATIKNGRLVNDMQHAQKIKGQDLNFRTANKKLVKSVFRQIVASDCFSTFSFNDFNQNIVSYSAQRGRVSKAWEIIKPMVDSEQYYLWNPCKKSVNTLLPTHMNKGQALMEIQKRLGIEPEFTAVAGDASNDIHMFNPQLAKYMICPSNAENCIKKIVRQNNGVISDKEYSWGIIDAFYKILTQ